MEGTDAPPRLCTRHSPLELVAMVVMVAMEVREEKAALVASVVEVVAKVAMVARVVLEMVRFRTSTYQWCRPG